MGNADWSLEQLERELSDSFAWLGRAERSGGIGAGESAALAEGVLRCMNGALLKVSESLEAQAALRRELVREREDLRRQREDQDARVRCLEDELCALRQALDEERGKVRHVLARLGEAQVPVAPPEEHLTRPLVIESAQGEYLGVSGRGGQALSLSGFLRLVEGGGPGRCGRVVASCWEASDTGWSLTLTVCAPGMQRCFVLCTSPTRTPSGNQVAVLSRMEADGRPVPREYVLQMFRQLREDMRD